MDFNWNLDQLAKWVQKWDPAEQDRSLICPHPKVWPVDDSFFQEGVDQLCNLLDLNRTRHFLAVCLASYLLASEKIPEAGLKWLREVMEPFEIGLPFNWKEIAKCHWLRIPFVLAGSDGQIVRYALLGHTEDLSLEARMPGWTGNCLDTAALKSVLISLDLAEQRFGKSFFFWPQLPFMEQRCLIQGSSLGLPIYLGCLSLAKKSQIPLIVCTGSLDPDAGLLPVERLEQKAQAARFSGYRAFMYPVSRDGQVKEIESADVEALPVLDLGSAECLWQNFRPNEGDHILRIMCSLDDPEAMAGNVLQTPGAVLDWLSSEDDCLKKNIWAIATDEESLEELVQEAEDELQQQDWNRQGLVSVFNLFDDSLLRTIKKKRSDLAFRLGQIMTRLGLVCGRKELAELGLKTTRSFRNDILSLDCGEDLYFIDTLLEIRVRQQARFYFEPDWQSLFNDQLVFFLEAFQRDFERRRELHPDAVHQELGLYHEFMARHFGLCGPGYLVQVEGHVQEGRKVFGNGNVACYLPRIKNFQAYLVYAYLDNGLFDKAERNLKDLLGVDRLSSYKPDSDNSLGHALLVRYLADTGLNLPEYMSWARQNWTRVDLSPIWLNWLYNLGRIETDIKNKIALWQRCLDGYFQETTGYGLVFALLPLAGLYELGDADRTELESRTRQILEVIGNEDINREHFAKIMEAKDWQDCLKQVQIEKNRLFPFDLR